MELPCRPVLRAVSLAIRLYIVSRCSGASISFFTILRKMRSPSPPWQQAAELPGLSITEMSREQKEAMQKVLTSLLDPIVSLTGMTSRNDWRSKVGSTGPI
jgi:hypothetical protein